MIETIPLGFVFGYVGVVRLLGMFPLQNRSDFVAEVCK